MDKNDFYSQMNELLELPENTINKSTVLADTDEWDSLAVISFIALAHKEYGATVPAQRITQCRSVDDLASLVMEFAGKRG